MPGSQNALSPHLNLNRSLRIDLAAAMRAAVMHDFHEGIDNHFTVLSASGESYFLNPYGLHWAEVCASDLLEIGLDGGVKDGAGFPDETAVCIHTGLHARGHQCVLHTHMPYATTLTQLEDMTLEVSGQNALGLIGKVTYDYSYSGLALDPNEGFRIADLLGEKTIVFMANHGVIVCGDTIGEAFRDLYFLERACMTQVLSMMTGKPRRMISQHVIDQTAVQFHQVSKFRGQSVGDMHFDSLKRLLNRTDPSYQN